MTEHGFRRAGELVVGIVAPIGSYHSKFERELNAALDAAEYDLVVHRLSKVFENLRELLPMVDKTSEEQRLRTAIAAGNELRRLSQRPEIMAVQAAARIRADRKPGEETKRRVHVLRSLKRKEEVEYLRRLYGPRFVLISLYLERPKRVRELMLKGVDAGAAEALIRMDEDEGIEHGQATRDAFQLADLFIDAGSADLFGQLQRFMDLLLGSPNYKPTMVEHGMFLAYGTSLRSGDLSRQVGAVLMKSDGTLIAEGCNDAPRYGGGPQWPDEHDTSDLVGGVDANEQIKQRMADTLANKLGRNVSQSHLKEALAASGIFDITEYGRAVHAEMAALMNCARLGVPAAECQLFCTTFPCHNCAKHLIAAGIESIYFIEPYPKSRALELHGEALSLLDEKRKLFIRPFVGVGPRRYLELFALRDQYGSRVRRKHRGEGLHWDRKTAYPAVHDRLDTYMDLEFKAAAELKEALERASQARGSPSSLQENLVADHEHQG